MSRGVRALFVCVVLLLLVSLFLNYHLISTREPGVDKGASVNLADTPEIGSPEDIPEVPEAVPEVAPKPNKNPEPIFIRQTYFYGKQLDIVLNRPFSGDSELKVAISPSIELGDFDEYGNYVDLSAEWEPGAIYSVTVKNAEEEVVAVVTAPNHPSRIAFRTYGKLFPLSSDFWNLGISTENLQGNLNVRVKKAYPNQALQFLNHPTNDDYSHTISEKEYPLKKVKNQEERLVLDLDEAGVPREPGLYALQLLDSECEYQNREQALIVTDLGVVATCGLSEVCVAVRSLKDNAPVTNANVELYTRKYQLVDTAKTDENGFCKMRYCDLIDEQDYVDFIVVSKENDTTICSAYFGQERGFRDHAELYCERGVCRPGEEMRVYATMRDKDLRAKGGVPLEFRLYDPHNDLVEKKVVSGDAQGLYAVKWSLAANAAVGQYYVRACAPNDEKTIYAHADFMVGEYIPDRVKVKLSCEADRDAFAVESNLHAQYYFGTPCSNGTVSEMVIARYTDFAPKNYEGFVFGSQEGGNLYSFNGAPQELDAEGNFKTKIDVSPLKNRIGAPVEISLEAACIPRGSGRSVSASQSLVWHFADYYLGGFHDDDSEEFAVKLVGVNPEGKEVSLMDKALKYELYRKTWNYVLKEKSNGTQERVWEFSCTTVQEGAIDLQNGWQSFSNVSQRGEFILVVKDENDAKRLQMDFWHWGGESGARLKDPRKMTFELDKKQYLPGETALVTFDSAMDGEGSAVPGLDNLDTPIRFAVKAGKNQVSIPIPENLQYGAYFVSFHLLCRKDTSSDPMHFEGMADFTVNQKNHRLSVQIDAPLEAKPKSEIPLVVKLTDDKDTPVSGEVLVWGVDEGVLALTAYKTPNPFDDFFGEISCTLATRDNYASLYPVVNAGTEKIGGGASGKFLAKNREKLETPALVFLGTFNTDENGVVTAMATLPDFSGEMRFMAIAVTEDCTGSGEASVVIRQETSLELTAPRAVAPEDEFSVIFQGFNHSLPNGVAHWEAEVDGAESLGALQGDFNLEKGGTGIASLRLKAGKNEGRCAIRVKMSMGESIASAKADVVNRVAAPAVDTLTIVEIPSGEEKEFDLDEYSSVDLGTMALSLTGSLDWLSKYPYGCLEQITATAFPLLAVQPLCDAGILPAEYAKGASQKIQLAQSELSCHRCYNGMMSMWPKGNTWMEGTYFAYLFYLEAEKQGFKLDEKFRKSMEQNLVAAQNNTSIETTATRAFTCFILSYINPTKAYLYAKTINDAKCDGFCKFLKAVVKIRSGYSAEGMAELEKVLATDFLNDHGKLAGFDSEIRRLGIALWVLADITPKNPSLKSMADSLLARRNAEGHWGNTQDNAWAALGLAKFCAKNPPQGDFSMTVLHDGETEECTSARHFSGKRKVLVRNTSKEAIQAFVHSRSVVPPTENISQGITIHREYQNLAGEPVTQAKRGELLRVVLKVTFQSDDIREFVLSDLLPGGLEIEDDELATRAKAMNDNDRRRVNFPVDYLEKRFDRFLLFGDVYGWYVNNECTYSYLVRAVSEGEFAVSPVSVESMYRVDLKAIEAPQMTRFTVLPNSDSNQ